MGSLGSEIQRRTEPAVNYYRRHIGDYLRDTSHLSLLEHGVYTRLLDIYYTRESAIPADQAARLIGARTKEEREAVERVLEEFFARDGDLWVQQRCEREIASAAEKAERNREVGKRGGRPRKTETQTVSEQKPNENPNGFQNGTQVEPKQNPSHKPIANSQERVARTRRTRAPERVPLPDDFCVSDRVRLWADAKGYGQLQERLEHFKSKARARGYVYADWDDAFMEAIRKDWAELNGKVTAGRSVDGGGKLKVAI